MNAHGAMTWNKLLLAETRGSSTEARRRQNAMALVGNGIKC